MGQTLTNGVYLPDEGERNCYTGLAANWRALDAHLGDANIHVTYADKEAWNNHVADTVKHVTAADKAKWDAVTSKADASALTAHAANLTIHVTAADKEAWNGKQASLSQTQLDAVNSGIDSSKVQQIATNTSDISSLQSGKANDNSVVHTSGNETIAGVKTFTDPQNLTGNTAIRIYSPSDEVDVLPSTTQGREIRFTDKNNAPISYFAFQHRASSAEPFRTCWRQLKVDGTSSYYSVNFNNLGEFYPEINNPIKLGTSTNRWKDVNTYLVNGLTPSSLSLPVIDRTKYVDISGYFTNTGNGDINTYSVTANGWIYLRLTDIDGCQLSVLDSSNNRLYGSTSSGSLEQLCLPVTAGTVVETQWTTSTSVTVAIARFIPCQGNI